MKFITLGFKEDGSTVLLAGAEIAPSEQRKAVDGYRRNGLPEGIVKAEIWQRNKTKVAVRPQPAAAEVEAPGAPSEEQEQKPEDKQPKPDKPTRGNKSAKPADQEEDPLK